MSRGDWMQTYTGRAFYPMNPQPEEVHPTDIAHALGMICRYGGHCVRFYSVAEHCVLMSYAAAPEDALWALLHDAGEAYLGDMVTPLKRQIPSYRARTAVMAAVRARYGLTGACPDWVKEADRRIVVDERAELLSPSVLPWTSLEGVPPLGVRITGWDPEEAKARYLTRLAELTYRGEAC